MTENNHLERIISFLKARFNKEFIRLAYNQKKGYISVFLLFVISTVISIYHVMIDTTNGLANFGGYTFGPYDGYWIYAIIIRDTIVHRDRDLFLNYVGTNPHSHYFLYSLISAVLSLLLNDIIIACMVVTIVSTGLSLYFLYFLLKFLDYSDKKISRILVLFISNYTLIRNLARPLVDTLAVLITIISIYLYYKFIKEKTKKNFVLFIISVVLAMITKDALIPIIFIPLGHTIISKSKEVSIVTALTFLIIPIIIYTSIIFSLGLWNTLLLRQTVLERYGEYHSIYYFVVSLALLLQLILPLFFIGFKGINKIKELRILIVWISIYVFARIIMPGPFDDRLWLPIMFSMIIIGYRGLEIVLKRFETTRMMELTVLGILIAIPYLMISYRIYLLI